MVAAPSASRRTRELIRAWPAGPPLPSPKEKASLLLDEASAGERSNSPANDASSAGSRSTSSLGISPCFMASAKEKDGPGVAEAVRGSTGGGVVLATAGGVDRVGAGVLATGGGVTGVGGGGVVFPVALLVDLDGDGVVPLSNWLISFRLVGVLDGKSGKSGTDRVGSGGMTVGVAVMGPVFATVGGGWTKSAGNKGINSLANRWAKTHTVPTRPRRASAAKKMRRR